MQNLMVMILSNRVSIPLTLHKKGKETAGTMDCIVKLENLNPNMNEAHCYKYPS